VIMNGTKKRKKEQLTIATEKDITYSTLSDGFDWFYFINNSLPELNLDETDTTTSFLEYKLEIPLIISAISGGEDTGDKLNMQLAEVSNDEKIALELGSIRPYLEDKAKLSILKEIRSICKNNPLIANLGAVQVKSYLKILPSVIEEIGIDCFSIHLNPLQEAIQPEGEPLYKGIKEAIKSLKREINTPIIVKEIGIGLSRNVVVELMNIGIEYINIAGAGGTSWVKIESERITDKLKREIAREFYDWGIPTATILNEIRDLTKDVKIIATGGIDRGIKFAKAIALGAHLAGGSRIFVKKWTEGGQNAIRELIHVWKEVLKIAMFCTGCKNIDEFRANKNIIREKYAFNSFT